MSREYTNKLHEMLDDGLVTHEFIVTCCLKYLSEDDVKEMMEMNELVTDEGEE